MTIDNMASLSDDDDEQLKLAIAMSLEQPQPDSTIEGVTDSTPQNKDPPSVTNGQLLLDLASDQSSKPSPSGLLGFDRKKMEEERLARLAARKRHASTDLDNFQKQENPLKKPKLQQSLGNAVQSLPSRVSTLGKPQAQVYKYPEKPSPESQYPKGAVRMTYSASQPRNQQVKDIKFEEIVLKDHLKLAVLSSFQWDLDWILTKINRYSTNILLVTAAKTEPERHQHELEAIKYGMKCCFPPMEGETGAMHSKLMLLVFSKFLRIVITSANLVPYDWGETGVMENAVWLIDLPRLPDDALVHTSDSLTFFGKELMFFLEQSDMPDFVLKGVLKFDFTATAPFAFIHSVGGAHLGSALQRTGFNCIARAVRTLNLRPPGNGSEVPKLHYATASLGALNDFLLAAMLAATKGISTATSTRDAGKNSRAGAAASARLVQAGKDREHVRVYFPTHKTVRDSRGGEGSAGTITARKDWYDKPTFPKEVMRDSISVRRGMLSHSKIMLCHAKEGETAWIYIGSHNLSEAAWGKVVKDRATGQMKLVLRNWECGILIPVPVERSNGAEGGIGSEAQKLDAVNGHGEVSSEKVKHEQSDGEGKENQLDSSSASKNVPTTIPLHEDSSRLRTLFSSVLDVPFVVPGASYGSDDEPWFFSNFG